jgi:hypothetical protein
MLREPATHVMLKVSAESVQFVHHQTQRLDYDHPFVNINKEPEILVIATRTDI